MTYLALARKWRPKTFAEVVGQSHVVQALTNSLDSDRVHHAFLFSGTRGVGKTTLARIFAKSLNCEKGVSSEPCQECAACLSIDEGRYVDLIEVDAASRTKVDDTRELLENVQYAPTTGKYKVYLIDEVHMLSGHSFNALLKTLEEPPEHVKFLFATTDPQKLPVTVISRCLQFNLRALRIEQIGNQLIKILNNEKTEFDKTSIDLLAKAANGSMRDGLSLLDQAISQGGGQVRLADVQNMLGTIKAEHTEQILNALATKDADSIMQVIADMSEQAVDFEMALDEVLMMLYQISLAQILPQSADDSVTKALAQQLSKEDVQLFYQIGLISKRDIALAPSLRVGFEMALLRMLTFEPGSESTQTLPTKPENSKASKSTVDQASTQQVPDQVAQPPTPESSSVVKSKSTASTNQITEPTVATREVQSEKKLTVTLVGNNEWGELVESLDISAPTNEMAMNCSCEKRSSDIAVLYLAPKHKFLLKPDRQNELSQALQRHCQSEIELKIDVQETKQETPAECLLRLGAAQLEQTKQNLHNDPAVQALMHEFDAKINEDSVKPN